MPAQNEENFVVNGVEREKAHWSTRSQMSLTSLRMRREQKLKCPRPASCSRAFIQPIEAVSGVLPVCIGYVAATTIIIITDWTTIDSTHDYYIQPSAVNNRKHEHRPRHRLRYISYMGMGIRCARSCINYVEKEQKCMNEMKWIVVVVLDCVLLRG